MGLLDILEIDSSSFATILDLCEGPDLDTVLREHGVSAGTCGVLHSLGVSCLPLFKVDRAS